MKITGGSVVVAPRGIYKVLAFRSGVNVPISSLRSVRVEDGVRDRYTRGTRIPGTDVAGRTIAGTFKRGDGKSFWVLERSRAVVIEVEGEEFDLVVAEVGDPNDVVRSLDAAMAASAVPSGER